MIDALAFSADKHRNQRRKDPDASPYINHPIALAHVLVIEGGVTDVPTLAAAILHDTIEDTETTYDELLAGFGRTIAEAVAAVTDDKALPKAERKRQQVLHAATLTRRARLVKLADKICNVRDVVANPPRGWDLERRRAYVDWATEVVDQLRGTHPRLERVFDAARSGRP